MFRSGLITHTNTIFVILKKGFNGVSQGDSWVFQQERGLCHFSHPAKPIEKACFYPCKCLWPWGEATERNSQVSCAFQRGGIWTFIALSQKQRKYIPKFFGFFLIFMWIMCHPKSLKNCRNTPSILFLLLFCTMEGGIQDNMLETIRGI